MTPAAARRMRLVGMLRKESLQIIRDPSSIAIAFVMPVVLLLLFGYGVSLDARDIPLAIVVEQPDANTASLSGAFQRSHYFRPTSYRTIQAAQQALDEHAVSAIVWMRSDFSRRLLGARSADIGVIVDGVDANQARITEGYLHGQGVSELAAVSLEPRIWFNAAVRSRDFLVPGLIAVIMTLIGAMLTSMVVAREWERGTMEALMVTPIRIGEMAFGKLLPYFILGMGGMLLSVIMALYVFDVPLRGSFWVLLLASALFMMVALGMGLLISVVARSQFVAGQLSIVATFLPAFILSGFIFEIGSMPQAIQVITHVIPARYFVAILHSVFLAGDIWPIILANSAALLLMAVIFLGVARRKTHKRLDA
jgi:ABC-2 type transport system permease protein